MIRIGLLVYYQRLVFTSEVSLSNWLINAKWNKKKNSHTYFGVESYSKCYFFINVVTALSSRVNEMLFDNLFLIHYHPDSKTLSNYQHRILLTTFIDTRLTWISSWLLPWTRVPIHTLYCQFSRQNLFWLLPKR